MIIVFFHVLYLIGKMVYKNYQSARLKDTNESVEESRVPATANLSSNKRHASDPLEPYDDEDDLPKAPRFSPPAYIQRYLAVGAVLVDPRYQGKIKKVVDFGCSELGFLIHLKHIPGIEEILCVDVDRETLELNKSKATPLNADYLQNRSNPLTICVYEGSVTHRDKRLANSDAVVAIELIEHLYPDTLMDFPYNVFGYIKPLVAIVTTPNADFNVLFPNMKSRFRHWDHKFEWTRLQFEDWSRNIVSRYPEYDVRFEGVCSGPPGTDDLGCCSQMAIFNKTRTTEMKINGVEGLFKTVTNQEYPYRVDNRSDEEKILDEASYHIRRFTQNNPECSEEYPLEALLKNLGKFIISPETLGEILSNGGWMVVDRDDGPVILCPTLSTFSDYDNELDEIDDNNDWPSSPTSYVGTSGTWVEGSVESNYDECWDDDYEIPAFAVRLNEESRTSRVEPVDNGVEFSLSRSIDTEDFDGIEVTNVSHVTSSLGSLESNRPSTFAETFESNRDSDGFENSHVGEIKNSSVENENDEAVIVNSRSNEDNEAIDGSSSFIKSPEASRAPELSKISLDNVVNNDELASLCSIYLECSRNDDRDSCPDNITNPSFDCTDLQRSFEDSMNKSSRVADCTNFCTSSPRVALEFGKSDEVRREMVNGEETDDNLLKSSSQSSLQSSENASTGTTNSSTSFRTVKKWYPPEVSKLYRNDNAVTLKGGNESSDVPSDEMTLERSRELSPSESSIEEETMIRATRLEAQKTPRSLSLRSTTSSRGTIETTVSSLEEAARGTTIEDPTTPSNCSNGLSSKNRQGEDVRARERVLDEVDSSVSVSKTSGRKIEETRQVAEAKVPSPEPPETPPNSWSPEIMDSGYPNSSSVRDDMTPEYDLSSIAQDRISDSESPSVAEVPRLGFIERADEVENGDLANNNRDGEGNNVMAAVDNDLDEDLQPLIDVLENDIENENDIYALENGFPMWLLRILERGGNVAGRQPAVERLDHDEPPQLDVHAAGDAGMPDPDEGFDSTSSESEESEADEDDYEDDDDDPNIEEISTESSEETIDWTNSGGDC